MDQFFFNEQIAEGVGRALPFIFAFLLVLHLIFWGAICLVLSSHLRRIPEEHRQMAPGMVWLLLVPCFSVVWNFWVFLKIPESFNSYFQSVGRTDLDDCGYHLGLAFAITMASTVIPVLNYLTIPVALILLIVCLWKSRSLAKQIPKAAA